MRRPPHGLGDVPPARRGSVAHVVIAACSGTARLSAEVGPVVHIDVASDADAAIRSLCERRHGCARPWPGSFQPLLIEAGWDDWAFFDVDVGVADMMMAHLGVQVVGGRFLVMLPAATPLPEFRGQLAAALRHLRLQETTIRADFLEARCEAMAEMIVHPRYTLPNAARFDFRGAVLAEDIYVFDPAGSAWRLFWLIVAARSVAIEGRNVIRG